MPYRWIFRRLSVRFEMFFFLSLPWRKWATCSAHTDENEKKSSHSKMKIKSNVSYYLLNANAKIKVEDKKKANTKVFHFIRYFIWECIHLDIRFFWIWWYDTQSHSMSHEQWKQKGEIGGITAFTLCIHWCHYYRQPKSLSMIQCNDYSPYCTFDQKLDGSCRIKCKRERNGSVQHVVSELKVFLW